MRRDVYLFSVMRAVLSRSTGLRENVRESLVPSRQGTHEGLLYLLGGPDDRRIPAMAHSWQAKQIRGVPPRIFDW